jgi:hypothetical protein
VYENLLQEFRYEIEDALQKRDLHPHPWGDQLDSLLQAVCVVFFLTILNDQPYRKQVIDDLN